MTPSRQSMAMVGMLLLLALTEREARAIELEGIPTVKYGIVVNSRDWADRAIPSYCRAPRSFLAPDAPRFIARPGKFPFWLDSKELEQWRAFNKLQTITPGSKLIAEEEDLLGFTR